MNNFYINCWQPNMLQAYYRHLSERSHGSFTLSYPIGVHINGVQQYRHIGFSRDFFCICCGKLGLRERDEIRISDKVYYSRCGDCSEKDIRLCVNSFMDDRLCWRWLKSLMLLREYILSSNYSAGANSVNNVIPYEIFEYILGIVGSGFNNGNKIACIEHMFK